MCLFDLVIVGNDISGLILTYSLIKSNIFKIGLICESCLLSSKLIENNEFFNLININILDKSILNKLGIWNFINNQFEGKYRLIKILKTKNFNNVIFDCSLYNISHFGFVFNKEKLTNSLFSLIKKDSKISIFYDFINTIVWKKEMVSIYLNKGNVIKTKLIIAADGYESKIKNFENIPSFFYRKDSSILTTIINHEIKHKDTLYKIIENKNRILYFFPLSHQNKSLLIWVLPKLKALKYKNIKQSFFEKKISILNDMQLGYCKLINGISNIPYVLQYSKKFISNRLILLGNSSYQIGYTEMFDINFRLNEIKMLRNKLIQLKTENKDIGHFFYYREYSKEIRYQSIMNVIKHKIFNKILLSNLIFNQKNLEIINFFFNLKIKNKIKFLNFLIKI
ncbi:MAG: hypothetical protein RA161_02165 [Arsenophonus sp.]|nr:MAG: hypothetical protein RA161_02165 [Arsenophonus sp.]